MRATAARENPRVAVLLFRAFWLLVLCAARGAWAAEEPFLPFMAQSVCLDARGAVQAGRLPFEPGCGRSRPLSAGESLPYRKHDWPGAADAAAQPRGYQASDSLLGTLLGRPAVIQTFDFGGGRRVFSRFDPADGGQAEGYPAPCGDAHRGAPIGGIAACGVGAVRAGSAMGPNTWG